MQLKHDVGLQQHCPPVLSNGAQPDATCGGTEDVVSIRCAVEGGEEPVGG